MNGSREVRVKLPAANRYRSAHLFGCNPLTYGKADQQFEVFVASRRMGTAAHTRISPSLVL
jgi:hypothetical protein